jgi:hypothetical protein
MDGAANANSNTGADRNAYTATYTDGGADYHAD